MSHQIDSSPEALLMDFDPQIQPVIAQAHQPGLSPETLLLDFIQATFKQSFHWEVDPFYSHNRPRIAGHDCAVRKAAVFFPLVQRRSGVYVLLTRRAEHLSQHPGQICFPGGQLESGDADETAAALRETHEEIGIAPEYIELYGTQPGLLTTTQFAMTPVIGALKPGYRLRPDHNEVAEIFEVPLAALMDPSRHRLHQLSLPLNPVRYYFSISWGGYFIWGATAALIRNFYRYLSAAQQALGSPAPAQ